MDEYGVTQAFEDLGEIENGSLSSEELVKAVSRVRAVIGSMADMLAGYESQGVLTGDD